MTELIIYAAIACVVCYMLYMVLGKNVGETPGKEPFEPSFKAPAATEDKVVRPSDPAFKGPAGEGLSEIAAADRSFSPAEFLDGAKAAYAMILEAYAEGDKHTLKSLLAAPVYDAYAAGIDARESEGQSQTTDLARIISAKITEASRSGKTGSITVEFDAELTAALFDSEGALIDGDLDFISRVTELWLFERRLASANPNWVLVSVTEAGEDTFGSAPDFTPDKDDS